MDDCLFYPYLNKQYPVIVSAKGMILTDSSEKEYIDACCGAITTNIGHGVTEVIDGIKAQLDKVTFTHRFKFTNEASQQLSVLLSNLSPGENNKVSFASGGGEAIEFAIKLAREYYIEINKPSKYKIISRWQSFHGNTLGALSAGGNILRRKRYSPMLIDFGHASPHNCIICPHLKDNGNCALECINDFERTIHREGPENVAAILIEPIVGTSLCVSIPKEGYLQSIRELCNKYDILMIADEVMTGVGRTGQFYAVQYWDIVPDLITLAKGLGGGYIPLGAIVISEKIYSAFKNNSQSFTHGYTFGGNPVASAAGLEVVNYILKNNLIHNSQEQGKYLLSKLKELEKKYQFIGEVSGLGLFTGMKFVKKKNPLETFPASDQITNKIVDTALNMGLVLYGAQGCIDGINGDGIIIAPPLNVVKEDVDTIVNRLEQVLLKLFSYS